jgi:MoaA/NifB/PqqE/SkfB family radical SAM enzyme
MFDTCTMKCGYCWLAESGRVLDAAQLAPFRSRAFIGKITHFFNSRTTSDVQWLLTFTGGEPLLAPNLGELCSALFQVGNQVAFYTALFVAESQPGFRFLIDHGFPEVDYIMASFHPEHEADESAFFRKLAALKKAGHHIFLRFVGHPARLHRLGELSARAEDLGVCFYPTALLSTNYPSRYTADQKRELSLHSYSLSQRILLEGGIDTNGVKCFAGSKVIAVNLQTGNITPCISTSQPLLGNILDDKLDLMTSEIVCPQSGINCTCDVHFQQDVVIGAEDSRSFEHMKRTGKAPVGSEEGISTLRQSGMNFRVSTKSGIGDVNNDERLYYSLREVKSSFRTNVVGVVTTMPQSQRLDQVIPSLFDLDEHVLCNSATASGTRPLTVVTPGDQWANAVIFPVRQPVAPSRLNRPMMITLTLTVLKGKIGAALADVSTRNYVDGVEIFATQGDATIQLAAESWNEVRWLILRNVAGGGQSSSVILRSIQTHTLEPGTRYSEPLNVTQPGEPGHKRAPSRC